MAKILISYRRSDSAGIVGRIYERLAARYGPDALFVDIDDIPLGLDFRSHIRKAIEDSAVVLAVIGHRWLGQRPDGSIRLHDDNDPVRVEIEAAMQSSVQLIPVLVEGAAMPGEGDLPPSLRELAYRNAAVVSAGLDFPIHMDRLVRELDKVVQPKAAPPAAPDGNKAALGAVSRLAKAVDFIGQHLRRDTTWAILAVTALPVTAWLATLAPAWPDGAVVLTCIASLAMLWFSYRRLRALEARTVRRLAAAASAAMVLLTLVYLPVLSIFTYQATPWANRAARGLTCTQEASAVYGDKCPNLGPDHLREAEFIAERLWTEPSIATVRIGIIVLWLTAFLAAAAVVAAGLVSRHRRGETASKQMG